MNALDVVIAAVALAAAIGGYRLGFVARVLSWVGLAVGLYVGARLLPPTLRAIGSQSPTVRLVAAASVLIGVAFVGQAVGLLIGSRLHRSLPLGPLRQVDRGIGAGVGIVGVLVALWLLLPAISSVPGWPARVTRESAVSVWVSDHFPAPPNTLARLRSLVGDDTFPQVFGVLHRAERTGPPPASVPLPAAVQVSVAASTVRVEGQACDRIQYGSGFTVAPGLVATNAHVVAGEPAGATSVLLPSGLTVGAVVVLFDPDRDLALLAVGNRLGERALPLGRATVGTTGAVFGHPGGQAGLMVNPASVAEQLTATGEDLYNTHSTRRQVSVLAAQLAPGDSGGPLVDASGSVVGVAFAIAVDRSGTAYALDSSELAADLRAPRSAAAGTQACLTE